MLSWRKLSQLSLREAILLFVVTNGLSAMFRERAFTLQFNVGTVLLVFLLVALPILGWGVLVIAIARTKVWLSIAKLKLPGSVLLWSGTNGLLVYLYQPMLVRHWVSAIFAMGVITALGWAVLFAAIARRFRWSSRACFLVPAVLFAGAGAIQFIFFPTQPLIFTLGLVIGYVCRKLVYPELPWNHPDTIDAPLTTLGSLNR
jgi:hypothetical protein